MVVQIIRAEWLRTMVQICKSEIQFRGQAFISRIAEKHSGCAALLLPLTDATPSAERLHRQCMLALAAPRVLSSLQAL